MIVRPCDHCPFRIDRPPFIRPERGSEILAALRNGGTFSCHRTVDYDAIDEDEELDEDGNERPIAGAGEEFCAGALVLLERTGGAERNQMVRIEERLGRLDLSKLDLGAPVASSFAEWIAYLEGREAEKSELDYCGIATQSCENPCGYGGSGGVWENEDPPTCDVYCESCGEPMCESCRSEKRPERCAECDEDLEPARA